MTRSASNSTSRRVEFGDFQTPVSLANEVCQTLQELGMNPASVVEPTCGTGAFIVAAIEAFPSLKHIIGVDINATYIQRAQQKIGTLKHSITTELLVRNFFHCDWPKIIRALPEPVSILGNPPWVTNSSLGLLRSTNLPSKVNLSSSDLVDSCGSC